MANFSMSTLMFRSPSSPSGAEDVRAGVFRLVRRVRSRQDAILELLAVSSPSYSPAAVRRATRTRDLIGGEGDWRGRPGLAEHDKPLGVRGLVVWGADRPLHPGTRKSALTLRSGGPPSCRSPVPALPSQRWFVDGPPPATYRRESRPRGPLPAGTAPFTTSMSPPLAPT